MESEKEVISICICGEEMEKEEMKDGIIPVCVKCQSNSEEELVEFLANLSM